MGAKPGQDYLADFEAIGVEPGCSPAELKAAYRRRVSDLHPDREGAQAAAHEPDRRQRLSDVNGAYRRLRHFQRLHGRMPGMAPAAAPEAGSDLGFAPLEPPRRSASRTWMIALFNVALLCLLATLIWALLERVGVGDRDPPVRRAFLAASPDGPESRLPDSAHRAPFRNRTTSTV